MRKSLVVAALGLLLALPSLAQDQAGGEGRRERRGAQQGRQMGPPRFEAMAERLAEELGLDEAQKAQYTLLVQKYTQLAEEERTRAGNFEDVIQQMREAREAGDDAKIQELRQKMQEMRRGGEELRVKFLDEVEPMLRPDQVEKLSQARERMANPQRGGPGGPGGPMMMMNRLKEDLKLDEAQAAKFDELAAAMREQAGGNREQVRDLMRQLREAREAGDTEKVQQLREQIAEVGGDPRVRMEQFFNDLESILREDQKATLAEHRERMQNFGGRGDGQGGQGREARRGQGVNIRTLFRAARSAELDENQTEQLKLMEAAAREDSEKIGRDRDAQAKLIEEYKGKILQLLTPDQAKKFEETLKEGEARERRDARPGRQDRQNP